MKHINKVQVMPESSQVLSAA